MSPTRSLRGLDCSLIVARGAGAKYRALSRSPGEHIAVSLWVPGPEVLLMLDCLRSRTKYGSLQDLWGADRSVSCLNLGPSVLWTNCAVRGLEPTIGCFRIFRGIDRSVSCWVSVPAGFFSDCGWDRLESSYRALSESTVSLSLAGLSPGIPRP